MTNLTYKSLFLVAIILVAALGFGLLNLQLTKDTGIGEINTSDEATLPAGPALDSDSSASEEVSPNDADIPVSEPVTEDAAISSSDASLPEAPAALANDDSLTIEIKASDDVIVPAGPALDIDPYAPEF